MTKQALVIGAGLTGLTTAFYLKKKGIDVQVLEKEERAGGVIRTHREDGFTFESGPNTGVLSHPEAVELFEDLGDRCRLEIADESAKKRLIWKNGKWEALPSGLLEGIKTPLFTFRDKLRLMGEPFRAKGKNPDETLANLVRRRMGQSFLDYAVDPFILGIYAGDPEYLVPRHALPKLYRLEQSYGSFIGGSIKKKIKENDPRQKKATREVFSVEGGLESLIHALTSHIGEENITTGCAELCIQKKEQRNFEISYSTKEQSHQLSTGEVFLTAGSHQLPEILEFVSGEELNKLHNLMYARVIEAALGFEQWKGIPLNAFGGLVPSREKRKILGVLFPSAFLKNRAPGNGALLTVFVGGVRNDHLVDLPDDEVRKIILSEISEMMQVPDPSPELFRLFRYEHAIPQYGKNTEERLETIRKLEHEHPGLHIAGNLRDGIGMADRIRQGRMLAGLML